MIIFVGSGRLGNQIFQINGLIEIGKKQKIYLYGFEDAKRVIKLDNNLEFINLSKSLMKLIIKLLISLFKYNKRLRLISWMNENQGEVKVEKGLFSKIIIGAEIYFQSEYYINKHLMGNIKLIDDVLKKKNVILSQKSYFIHVRRGDYNSWPSYKMNAVVPIKWYKDLIKKIKYENKNCKFYIFSDDKNIKEEFLELNNLIFVENCISEIDLYHLIGCCEGGIMAPSTFSLAAVFIAGSPEKKYYAPKYWAGFKSGAWFPERMKIDFIEYVDVQL